MKLSAQLEEAYLAGKLNHLRDKLWSFLDVHGNDLRDFIDKFEATNGAWTLDALTKYWILTSNLPFDLKTYLKEQTQAIQRDLGPKIADPEARTKLVTEWVKSNAAVFRDHSMLEQVYCFEKMKSEVLPKLAERLHYTGKLS